MGMGYILGTLASILFWKLDRQNVFSRIINFMRRIVKNEVILQLICTAILVVFILCVRMGRSEMANFITALVVVDISNTERKNLNKKEKVKFYDSISTISTAMVCGFTAPLFYALVLGNKYAMVYAIVFNLSIEQDFSAFRAATLVLNIVPALIDEIFLYVIYVVRNKRMTIDFKGDYFMNVFTRPVLNVDIIAAYIESVNFYYCFTSGSTSYLKGYGSYNNKINDVCVKDYLSLTYAVCMVIFIVFFLLIRVMS